MVSGGLRLNPGTSPKGGREGVRRPEIDAQRCKQGRGDTRGTPLPDTELVGSFATFLSVISCTRLTWDLVFCNVHLVLSGTGGQNSGEVRVRPDSLRWGRRERRPGLRADKTLSEVLSADPGPAREVGVGGA